MMGQARRGDFGFRRRSSRDVHIAMNSRATERYLGPCRKARTRRSELLFTALNRFSPDGILASRARL